MNEREALREAAERRRLSTRHLTIVSGATVLSVLLVIFIVQDVARQPVLVTSLASSAFLLYYQPRNEINDFKPLVFGHLLAVMMGYGASLLLPIPYWSSILSVVGTVVLLSLLRLVHPPAISTSLVFSYRPYELDAVVTFLLSLVVILALGLIYLLLRHGIRSTHWASFFDLKE